VRARGAWWGALFLAVLALSPARAVEPGEILADPVQEARARELSARLRCLVCQNQSIDDSNAPLARDLRVLLRERIRAGDQDSEVMNFLVARYGEFILLQPRFAAHTLLLWLGPPLLLGLGALGLSLNARRLRLKARNGGAPLSADEQREVQAVLAKAPSSD